MSVKVAPSTQQADVEGHETGAAVNVVVTVDWPVRSFTLPRNAGSI
jgi:hypothetical protein